MSSESHLGGRGLAGESCVEAFLIGDYVFRDGTTGVALVAPLLQSALCSSCARQLGLALLERGSRRADGTIDTEVLIDAISSVLARTTPGSREGGGHDPPV